MAEEASSGSNPLILNFQSICQEVEIPDEEYSTALQFKETLQELLSQEFPGCQLIWFRNWYLKLKNISSSTSSNELMFFLDRDGIFGNDAAGEGTEVNVISQELRPATSIIRKTFWNTAEVKPLRIVEATDEMGPRARSNDDFRLSFHCQKNDLMFSLLPEPNLIPQIQACRLVSYFCTFDPRVKPLLTLIRYWTKTNGIALDKPGFTYRATGGSHPPDPSTLDWLVIFFLRYKKIVPTPREIMERPHQILKFNGVDMGFDEDANFAQQFFSRYDGTDKNLHVVNIFSLAKEFFDFYSEELLLELRKVVLNMRDGEVIPMDLFAGKVGNWQGIQSKMSKYEKKRTRLRARETPTPNVILLHPLSLLYRFSFCGITFVKSVCPAMQITSNKLKQALDGFKTGKTVDMKSTFKLRT